MWKYLLAWFPMVMIAIANGVARQALYAPLVGDHAAHQISTIIAIVLFGLYIRWVIRRWPPSSTARAVLTGILWLSMTVAFEFLFGHYVAGNSWEKLLADYNIAAGRLWPVVLFWVTITPWLFYRMASPPRQRTGS